MSRDIWNRLIDEVRNAHTLSADFQAFCPLPRDLTPTDVTFFDIPPRQLFEAETDLPVTPFSGLCDSLRAASPYATWRETYKDTDIGQDFMDRFGCYCLIGEGGAFSSREMLAYVVYMPPHLYYPWHDHPAEELYLVLAGQADFHRDGEESETLAAGQSSFHASSQPHAMTTRDQPVVALVLWRNNFETKPKLTT